VQLRAPYIARVFAADDSGTPVFLGEDILAYLVLAFSAALFVGNLLAILRPPPPSDGEAVRAPVGRSLIMAGVGFVGAVWALASLVAG
jgi:hypothetical protein